MADIMVTVVARIKAKPEMVQVVKAELLKLLAPTRVERGCINFDMHQALHDESQFLFHENWESEACLRDHLNAPHIRNWFGKSETLLAEPVDVTLWQKVA